jgi:hypothetical protein
MTFRCSDGGMRAATAVAMRPSFPAVAASCLLTLAGCAQEPALDPESIDGLDAVEDGEVVEDGKADDFLSATAREFVVSGTTGVTLEPEWQRRTETERLARVRELVSLKQVAISWFLNLYLVDKEREDANAGWGGFGAMAKNGDLESANIRRMGTTLTYEFDFAQVIAGRVDLMSRLPTMQGSALPDGTRTRTFVLQMGRPTNTQLAQLETNGEWYRQAPFSAWNPATQPASAREDVTLTIRPERESVDAWLDYPRLFEDGLLDIDVHLGWDYHANYHQMHAQAMWTWLRARDFTAPVSSFAALDRDSGPFTRTITANGRTVRVEVRLFWGHDGGSTDPDTAAGGRLLEADMRDSLARRDVIVYGGHSGPFYGFALANWRMTEEGDLDDSELATVTMPSDRYQIVVADGCDTYQLGSAFGRNPAHPNLRGLDVVTTTSFSDASAPTTLQDFIGRLIERDSRGRHRPQTVRTFLRDADDNGGYGFHTMYGMHGIDDNTRLHPYAAREMLGQACAANTDCGDLGNLCIRNSSRTPRYCSAACTDTSGCPEGWSCRQIASTSARTIYGNACVRN